MAEKIGLNNDVRELKLGKSFEHDGKAAFHSLRYDFKPASVDTSQVASLAVGDKGSVEVTVPHVEGSGTANTVYKGNTRPTQKECVLIIDHKTGEIKLEKLTSTVVLKKTRKEGSSKVSRPLTPTEQKVKDSKSHSPSKKRAETSSGPHGSSGTTHSSQEPKNQPELSMPASLGVDVMSASDMDISSASSSSSDSDSEPEENPPPKVTSSQPPAAATAVAPTGHRGGTRPAFMSTLSEDLRLSESGSESD